MTRLARRPLGPSPRRSVLPKAAACLLCRGSRVRLVHKPHADPARSAPVVAVCEDCKHFWAAPATV
jgi:hypothetical protein